MKTETQFILLCSRLTLEKKAEAKIKELAARGLDWQAILSKSIKEKVLPLVFFNICKLSLTREIPEEILSEFNRINYGNIGQNILLYDELKNLLRWFNQAQIDVIVLKGIDYIERLYDKNISLRAVGDIDLLVKDHDLLAVKNLLLAAGYVQKRGWFEQPHIDFHHLVPFQNSKNNVMLEVHWTISMYEQIFKIDMTEVWQRAQSHKLGAMKMLSLSPEDMIFHQCLHLFMVHQGILNLKNLCDLAEIIKRFMTVIDWELIFELCEQSEINDLIYSGLYCVNELFQLQIPPFVLMQLQRQWPERKVQKINAAIQTSISLFSSRVSNDSFARINWVFKPISKLKLLYLTFFPPLELLRKRYAVESNSSLVCFYYLVRPLQLLILIFK